MKKFLVILLTMFVGIVVNAQGLHNYYNASSNSYVQVGIGNGYILFSYPPNQIVRLNRIAIQNGLYYYGDNKFQVAVTQNSSQVCIIAAGATMWYNYVGPVNVQPTAPIYNNNNTNNSNHSSYKCPWCHGTGRIAKDDHVPQYTGNDYVVEKTCPECGLRYYSTYRNHYHMNCSHCNGTGKITR